MSYTEFSTDNADYFLVYAPIHDAASINEDILKQPKLDGLDAIVFESPGNINHSTTMFFSQYKEIIEDVKDSKKEISLYMVDVKLTGGGFASSIGFFALQLGAGVILCRQGVYELKKKTSRRQFIKGGLKTLLGAAILGPHISQAINGFVEGEPVPAVPEITTALHYLPPTPMVELRNAISARKTEEFIAPQLEKKLGKKPLIAIIYACGHSGLKTDLKHKD